MAGIGWTQEPPSEQPPVFDLPEIVVPGKRPQPPSTTPAAVRVITREELERLGARTVGDALRIIPDVAIRAYGGPGSLAQASLRGSTPAQVLVLLDGVPLNSVALAQVDLNTISTDAVERIEVLPGPFAAIYGSGSLGGVISIVTARAIGTRVQARAGGYGERSLSASFGETELAPWQLSATNDSTQGHRLNSDHTGTTIVGKLALSPTTGLLIHHFSTDLGLPGDISSPSITDRQSERRSILQMTVGQGGRMYYLSDLLTSTSSFGVDSYYSSVAGGEFQHVWRRSERALLTGGVELHHSTIDANVAGSTVAGQATSAATYLQYDAAASARLLTSLGVRIDAHSIYGTTVNPRAGLVFQVDDATLLRVAVGRTFRGPTFLDLFFPGCSNPSLAPETAWAVEAVLERKVDHGVMSVVVFGKEATNLIAFVPPCSLQNIGVASIWGASGEFRGALGPWTGAVSLSAMRARDVSTGASLLRVPGFTAQTTLSRRWGQDAAFTVAAEYMGVRLDRDFSGATVEMPPFVNVRVRYQLTMASGWLLIVGVDNAFDQAYEVIKGYPAPGRTVFLSTTVTF